MSLYVMYVNVTCKQHSCVQWKTTNSFNHVQIRSLNAQYTYLWVWRHIHAPFLNVSSSALDCNKLVFPLSVFLKGSMELI